ncbi:hypothetical protein sphantq_00668 [Sphingobium sp. AntQ-1]|uniref:hypothetical protein n=1 Tax=Sphingobium sp. AntQ-1 TaxID=2930091 RepID=UPI00234E70A2|nr:hypothetical protein [Sphingobium sp. AntQ-1]WCP12271.1 hypothetical protein sphantq_00668 [Sphingobium sp. AntQ-1]
MSRPRNDLDKGRACTKWSAAEDELLRDIYPDYRALEKRLSGRTLSAIKHRVRVLGIVSRRHVWTNVEVARLRKAYRESVADKELTVLFPGLRLSQIKSKACHIGAERRKPRLALFDDPALDAIRRRSKEMCISFVELDRRAGTGRFFQKSCRRTSLKHIARAARVLQAQIRIEWGE